MSQPGEITTPSEVENGQKLPVEQLKSIPSDSESKVKNEPVSQETIEEMGKILKDLPRLDEDYAYEIPYRTERRMASEGVFDEETGVYLQATFNAGNKSSRLKNGTGMVIILSTPSLQHREDTSIHLNKMVEAIREIYGESDDLEKEIEQTKRNASLDENDRVKFELLLHESGPVLNGFAVTRQNERVPLQWWAKEPKRQISESGGQFLKGILKRVVQKQKEEDEENKLLTKLIVEQVKDEAVPNDEEHVYEYAYHATSRGNIPSISKYGLQPSGSLSKEPGTIFFTGWDSATLAHSDEEEVSVLYRFRLHDMPEVAKEFGFEKDDSLTGYPISVGTRHPIPTELLGFSLDRGKTWMPTVSRKNPEVGKPS